MSKSNRKSKKSFDQEVANFFRSENPLDLLGKFSEDPNVISSVPFWSHPKNVQFCLSLHKWQEGLHPLIKGFLAFQTKANSSVIKEEELSKLLLHFMNLDPWFTIEEIRSQKIFLFPIFLEILQNWGSDCKDEQLIDLLDQMKLVHNLHLQIQSDLVKFTSQIAAYSWIEVISLLTIWWENQFAADNLEIPIPTLEIHPYMGEVYSIAIRAKFRGSESPPHFEDPVKFQEQFLLVLQRCESPTFWRPFKELMGIPLRIVAHRIAIDSFVYQKHHFVSLEGAESKHILIPESKEREKQWDKIGEQYQQLEGYYTKYGMQALAPERRGIPELINAFNPGHQIRWLNLGMPETVKLNGNRIDTSRAVLFLTALGEFHKERYFKSFVEAYGTSKEANDSFPTLSAIRSAIHGTNLWFKPMMGPINITTSDYMVQRIMGKVGFHQEMDPEELVAAVEYLALDLAKCSPGFEFHLQEFPFLKMGKVIVYLTSNLVLSNPSYLMQNRLFHEAIQQRKRRRGEMMKEISTNFEEILRRIMNHHEIQVKSEGVKLVKDGKDLTDIDVLAWKGNELLVIQAKNTYSRHRHKSIAEYQQVLESAGYQLDVSIQYIEKNKASFLKEQGIPILPEKLKVYGLVVSSTPEGNYERYGQGRYPKISAEELRIIMANTKGILVNWELESLAKELGSRAAAENRLIQIQLGQCEGDPYTKLKAVRLRQQDFLKDFAASLDSWEGQEPSISKLVARIEEDWLWKDIIYIENTDTPSVDATKNEKEAFVSFHVGLHHFNQEEYKQSIPLFEKAWHLFPKAEYLLHLADATAERGLKVDSLQWYNLCIEEYPEVIAGYINRGTTYAELGNLQEALEDYKEAVKIDPNNSQALNALITLQLQIDSESIDIEQFQHAIKLDPKNLLLYQQFSLKQFQRLHELMQKKKTIDNLFDLADCHFLLGEMNQALICLNQIIDQDPTNTDALYSRAWFKVDQGMLEVAKADFEKIVEIDPHHAYAWDQIGAIELEFDNFDTSQDAYQKALAIDQNAPRICYNYGVFLFHTKKYQEAIPWLEKAVPDLEAGVNALIILAETYEALEDWASARACYREAVIRGKDDAYRGWAKNEMKLNPPYQV